MMLLSVVCGDVEETVGEETFAIQTNLFSFNTCSYHIYGNNDIWDNRFFVLILNTVSFFGNRD